jgi:hypothetical protein
VSTADAPHADAAATLPHAAPQGVSLAHALAAAATSPRSYEWVTDARDVAAARRLLECKRRAAARRRRASSAVGESDAAEDAADVATERAVAAGSSCPVFSAGGMLVALPTRDGAVHMFRPWFFSASQLERARPSLI